jgi:NADPH:quinone reductase-like Zn-dependent oxidoreductase
LICHELNKKLMTTKKMKAMVATGYGSPDVLQLKEVQRPEPKSGEILVRVMTTAATTSDAMIRSGKQYLARLVTGLIKPKQPIPGTGFAGVVEGVGEGVENYQIGDRVFGETTFGFSANAEYLTVSGKRSDSTHARDNGLL